jgi:lipopolysaccharide/colanic/teichoic acid biosynthesis glycosyltransferase
MNIKRLFDLVFSLLLLVLLGGFLIAGYLMASLDTRSSGFFFQKRIGQFGKVFWIFKLKTVHPKTRKISRFGSFCRRSKIDELPQLFNIVVGQMSFVGPRPDIPGYYDLLQGEARKILELKPGLTSLASLKYFNEEALLTKQMNPLQYNDEVVFPDKVKLNLDYYYKRSFIGDLKIIIQTVLRYKNE